MCFDHFFPNTKHIIVKKKKKKTNSQTCYHATKGHLEKKECKTELTSKAHEASSHPVTGNMYCLCYNRVIELVSWSEIIWITNFRGNHLFKFLLKVRAKLFLVHDVICCTACKDRHNLTLAEVAGKRNPRTGKPCILDMNSVIAGSLKTPSQKEFQTALLLKCWRF